MKEDKQIQLHLTSHRYSFIDLGLAVVRSFDCTMPENFHTLFFHVHCHIFLMQFSQRQAVCKKLCCFKGKHATITTANKHTGYYLSQILNCLCFEKLPVQLLWHVTRVNDLE